MDLLSVVRLEKPRAVTVGVRPLRQGETPILAATAGRVVEMAAEEPEDSPSTALQATPVQSVAPPVEQAPDAAQSHPDSSNIVRIIVDDTDEEGEQSQPLTRKRAPAGGYGEGPSKRPRSEAEEGASLEDAHME